MNKYKIKEYAAFTMTQYDDHFKNHFLETKRELELSGYEVYMDDIVPRTEVLFLDQIQMMKLVADLKEMEVKRIHGSYWAYPTSFLGGYHFDELIQRFGSVNNVINYYGDLTGKHMMSRWVDEYRLSVEIEAEAYTFHLIDYAPIDGLWEFTISKDLIKTFMTSLLQKFINALLEAELLSGSSPKIEIETSGWGLEYGTQTANDYLTILNQIYDPFNRVKIAWELNHLLHAIGYDPMVKQAKFFLPPDELTMEMREIERIYGTQPKLFVEKWLASQILNPYIIHKIGSLHVSDNRLKEIEYFRNGQFQGDRLKMIKGLSTWDEKENFGVKIVLSEYDNHLTLGTGVISSEFLKGVIFEVSKKSHEFSLLHELKNSKKLNQELRQQLDYLWRD